MPLQSPSCISPVASKRLAVSTFRPIRIFVHLSALFPLVSAILPYLQHCCAVSIFTLFAARYVRFCGRAPPLYPHPTYTLSPGVQVPSLIYTRTIFPKHLSAMFRVQFSRNPWCVCTTCVYMMSVHAQAITPSCPYWCVRVCVCVSALNNAYALGLESLLMYLKNTSVCTGGGVCTVRSGRPSVVCELQS